MVYMSLKSACWELDPKAAVQTGGLCDKAFVGGSRPVAGGVIRK